MFHRHLLDVKEFYGVDFLKYRKLTFLRSKLRFVLICLRKSSWNTKLMSPVTPHGLRSFITLRQGCLLSLSVINSPLTVIWHPCHGGLRSKTTPRLRDSVVLGRTPRGVYGTQP